MILVDINVHWKTFSHLLRQTQATGNLVSDARLAALAIEHNIEIASCDPDFAKFPDLRWINPATPTSPPSMAAPT